MKTKKSLNVDKGGTGGGGQSMWEISFLALLSVLLYFFSHQWHRFNVSDPKDQPAIC